MKLKFQSSIRKGLRIMLYLVLVLMACLLMITGVMLYNSPGNVLPFRDKNGNELEGSISEKIFVKINGTEQGMFIKGKDKTKPVLLFLHGGPGMPEYAISRKYPIILENYFTVCWWEQRGTGLSYNAELKPDQLSFEQLISDVIEVSNYLRKRFKQDKIYLMAHSAGSFIGIQAAAIAPELYKAYIGIAQISNQLESEKLAYKYMIDTYKKQGDKKMLQVFEKYPIAAINTPSYYTMRDAPMHKLGIGTTHSMKSVITGVFWPVMLNKEYSLAEKINIWRGKFFSTKTAGLWNKLVVTDLTKEVNCLKIPVFFIHGIYDYTVSYPLAKDYYEKIQSPEKAFYTFEHSAHSPLFEETDKMKEVLQEIILKTNKK